MTMQRCQDLSVYRKSIRINIKIALPVAWKGDFNRIIYLIFKDFAVLRTRKPLSTNTLPKISV